MIGDNSDLFAYFPSQEELSEYLGNVSTILKFGAKASAPFNLVVAAGAGLAATITGGISAGLKPQEAPKASLPSGQFEKRFPQKGPWGFTPFR